MLTFAGGHSSQLMLNLLMLAVRALSIALSFWTGSVMRPRHTNCSNRFCIVCLRIVSLRIFVLTLSALCAVPSEGRPPAAGTQAPQSIGSISSTGSVSINGLPAPADATIFSGDTVRTTETGTAAISISGKGAIKLAPNTEMSFAPDPRYTGELRAGMVVLNSFGGATDISVRTGTYVVAPVMQAQQSASKIERQADGSFTISCLDGSVGLIPLEGATGRVLQSGQSIKVLPSGQFEQVPRGAEAPATAPPESPSPGTPAPPPVHANNKKDTYILLGVAGGGAVIIAAALAGRGHGNSSVSPSTP